MIQATTPLTVHDAVVPVRRIGLSTNLLHLLLVCQVLIVCAAVLSYMKVAPQLTPVTRGSDIQQVREAILQRVSGQLVEQQVPIGAAQYAYESNVRGFALNGYTYYYTLGTARSADPLGRGAIARNDIEIVHEEPVGATQLVIYRVLP